MFPSIHNRHGLKLDNTFSNFPSSTMRYEFQDKHRRSPHLIVDKSVLLVMLFRLRLSTQIPFSNNDDVVQKNLFEIPRKFLLTIVDASEPALL